jgi:hypothetical protein
MNRVTIRRFDVVRTATVAAVLYAVIAVVFALLFFLPIAILTSLAGSSGGAREMGALFGAGVVGVLVLAVVGALFYAVVGWVMTAIVCVLYNFVAGRVGGIRVEVQVEGPYPGGPGYGVPAYPGYGAPGGYGAQYGAPPTSYGTPGAVQPPISFNPPGYTPPPPGIPG